MNKISIGILSYKRTDLLIETIKDIALTQYELDLIILNNNDDIDILGDINQVLAGTNITLNYLWFQKNLGVSTGRREIMRACQTDIIIMLDDDVEILSIDTVISSVLLEFEKDDKLGGIAFNIIDKKTGGHNRYEIPHKDKSIDMSKRFYTYLMIGAGHALLRSVSLDVGNYANDFGLYGCEEIDLGFRIINAEYKIVYNPNCQVNHKKSPDGRFSGVLVNYLAFVNRTKIAKRHFKKRYFISCFLVRSLYFLYKTKNIQMYYKGVKEIFKDKTKKQFGQYFYRYVKEVHGFINY